MSPVKEIGDTPFTPTHLFAGITHNSIRFVIPAKASIQAAEGKCRLLTLDSGSGAGMTSSILPSVPMPSGDWNGKAGGFE